MTFLNYIMLIGLAAVAIPILIHLLNRHKAKLVEWGAMRFLLASLASRTPPDNATLWLAMFLMPMAGRWPDAAARNSPVSPR